MNTRAQAARAALQSVLPFFRQHFGKVSLSLKADGSSVSMADLSISKSLTASLQTAFPQDTVLSEEAFPTTPATFATGHHTWVIDPVDGTDNYAMSHPHCGISIALFEGTRPHYGLLYEHSLQAVLESDPSGGLRLNGELFRPPPVAKDPNFLALLFPLKGVQFTALAPFLRSKRVRSLGSVVSHAVYLALGKVDATVSFKSKIWDIAAATPILKASLRHCLWLRSLEGPLEKPNEPFPFLGGSEKFCQKLQSALLET